MEPIQTNANIDGLRDCKMSRAKHKAFERALERRAKADAEQGELAQKLRARSIELTASLFLKAQDKRTRKSARKKELVLLSSLANPCVSFCGFVDKITNK